MPVHHPVMLLLIALPPSCHIGAAAPPKPVTSRGYGSGQAQVAPSQAQKPQPAAPPFYPDKLRLLVWRDDRGRERPIRRPGDWPRRRAHILASLQWVMGPLPDDSRRVPVEMRIESSESLAAFKRHRITFAVEPGDRLPAYLLIPRAQPRKAPAMLCLHQTTPLGKGEPAGLGPKTNLHCARELALRGYVTLAPDYPNFGDYRCDPYARGYDSATMKDIWNHQRAVDLLQSLPEVDSGRIGVIGHSLGGHNALFVAAFDPRIKAVVTSCGFNSFFKYYGGNLTGWSQVTAPAHAPSR